MTAWSATGEPVGPSVPSSPENAAIPVHPAGPGAPVARPMAPSPTAELRRARAENRQWRMLAGLLVTGVLLGLAQAGLWSGIAPGEVFKVFTDGGYGSLPTASGFRYTAIAMFCLIGLIVGVCQAVGAWSWRSVRGTITLLGVGLGAAVGALTAYLIGRALAGGVVPGSVGASPVERIVHAPPVSGSAIVLLAQPAAALVVYTMLAAWTGRADLGRMPAGTSRSDPVRSGESGGRVDLGPAGSAPAAVDLSDLPGRFRAPGQPGPVSRAGVAEHPWSAGPVEVGESLP